MSTSTGRVGLERAVKFLGSDLSGMHQAPEGVDQLMEEWCRLAGVPRLHYRIITREVGAANMKRLTVRGLKSRLFLEARVNPDCGGNDNCWLVSVVLEMAELAVHEKKLREAADAVNDRSVERKTPAPSEPKAAPKDPYADLTLEQLAALRGEHSEAKSQAGQTVALMEQNIGQLDAQIASIKMDVETLEGDLQKKRNMLATRNENRGDSSRTLEQSRQKCISCTKEIAKIDEAIAAKTKAVASEIASPLRSLIEDEARKRGISPEAVLAALSTT